MLPIGKSRPRKLSDSATAKTKIDFENLAIEENLLVQAKEIYDNFVMRELLIRQRKRSDCSRKAEGQFDTFFITLLSLL